MPILIVDEDDFIDCVLVYDVYIPHIWKESVVEH